MKHGSEEVHVRPRVDLVTIPRSQLRSHVGRCPAHAGDVTRARNEGGEVVAIANRDPPVEQVDLAVAPEHHVARLQVEMDDPARVREVHRVAHLNQRSKVPLHASAVAERHGPVDTLDALHEEQRRFLAAVERMNRDHVGVLELTAQPRLPEKRLGRGGVVGSERRLHGHLTTETALLTGADDAHATTPELVAQLHEGHAISGAGGQLLHPTHPGGGPHDGLTGNDRALGVDLQLRLPDPSLVPDGVELGHAVVGGVHVSRRQTTTPDAGRAPLVPPGRELT